MVPLHASATAAIACTMSLHPISCCQYYAVPQCGMLCPVMLCCLCSYVVSDGGACMQMIAPRLLAEDSANNYLPSQSSSASGTTDSPASTPSAEQAELAQGPFLRVSVPASAAELEPQNPAVAESCSEPQALPAPQSTHVS